MSLQQIFHKEIFMRLSIQLSESISQHYQSLTSAQKRIADYIMGHTTEVALLTIHRLAAQIGVSPSTITRFAVEMGFSGYPELQEIAKGSVRKQLESDGHPTVALDAYGASFDREVRAIEELRQLNPSSLLDQAVTLLLNAHEIYIIGMRSSAGLADYLTFQLNRALGTATLLSGDGGYLLEQRMRLKEGDLLVAISFPPYTRSTYESVIYAKEHGASVLAITDGPRSPLAGPADIVLQVPFDHETMFHSNATALVIEHALIAGVVAQRPEQVRNRVEQIREAIAQAGVRMA
jgi:DNA-binding MurR/RpiR family transcriptional regulator